MKPLTKLFTYLIFIFLTIQAWSQENGQITREMLASYRSATAENESIFAIVNAVTNNQINKLAINRNNLGYLFQIPGKN